ncbi:uncharacterized protein EAE98_010652 [Botrytis deweyae]|uniref:Myb-like domain-containing protein n=2 Tax=Botrytis TaxID=33196 RepID=A0A4Z1K6J2_9HELO|nr:uncharacterized protein EAE98_010652 [Botrytis deweyae]KAF7916553.1 hypothetical protein EAE99_009735 [Botrytis elliptica]KAF7916643.1 hypothetical protein EAE98_010652 [Botrytis deweyae]TGO76953.1 hypothetical protein BELL_0130g00240 [Botrytis elliptica]
MPSQWDHRADKDLLLAIIEGNNLKAIEWPIISESLQKKGYSFTKEACRQHFQKIRKESRIGSPSASTRATSAATSVKKRKSKAASIEEGQENEEEETPSKNQSKRVKKESDDQSAAELGVESEE